VRTSDPAQKAEERTMERPTSLFSGRKGAVNRQEQIVIVEKKLAQAKKNLKLFKRRELNTPAAENPNPLAAKLESEVSAYEFSIRELKAVQR
jgi:hypothetical protein